MLIGWAETITLVAFRVRRTAESAAAAQIFRADRLPRLVELCSLQSKGVQDTYKSTMQNGARKP